MNRGTRDLLFIVAGLLLSAVTLWAGAGYDTRLSKDVEYLNAVGSRPRGAKDLERSLATAFRTDAARIARAAEGPVGYGGHRGRVRRCLAPGGGNL